LLLARRPRGEGRQIAAFRIVKLLSLKQGLRRGMVSGALELDGGAIVV
jgi:hypothetical protein